MRETVSTMDEAASTTDGLGPAGAGVEVVLAANREGNRDRLGQSQREAKHA